MIAALLALAVAQDPVAAAGPAPDAVVAVVDRLSDLGLTHEAFAEALRAATTAATPRERKRYDLLAGSVLWSAQEWDLARRHFSAGRPDPDYRLAAAMSAAADDAPAATALLLGDDARPAARFVVGWAQLHAHDAAGALVTWRPLQDDPVVGHHASLLVDEVSTWRRVPHRSPAAAGVLSLVVPGAGQAYVGRWGEAASALIVNGLLIASAVELGRGERWFGVGTVAVFELGFYGGGLLSAVNGARRFNRRAWERKVAPLTAHEPHPVIRDTTVELGW